MPEIIISGLERVFPGGNRAVDNVDLTIPDGELFTLLGPSGCGKTTTLACIAGLDTPSGGQIRIGSRVIFDSETRTNIPCEERNIGMVFQSYALWPQMTVAENLDLPLRIRKVPGADRKRMIREALDMVELGHLGHRYPHELSGGQQQRVALARALVYAPTVLLLDEPLSNLDARLRHQARGWIKRIQQELRITTIYVTHDQEEALAMSDTIAVLSQGCVMQCADPQGVYEEPATLEVAAFMGRMNFLQGSVIALSGNTVSVKLDGPGDVVTAPKVPNIAPGAAVTLAFRPEKVILRESNVAAERAGNVLHAEVIQETYVGFRYEYMVRYGDTVFEAFGDQALGPRGCTVRIDGPSIRVYATDRRVNKGAARIAA